MDEPRPSAYVTYREAGPEYFLKRTLAGTRASGRSGR